MILFWIIQPISREQVTQHAAIAEDNAWLDIVPFSFQGQKLVKTSPEDSSSCQVFFLTLALCQFKNSP